jgi:hypothetical protein
MATNSLFRYYESRSKSVFNMPERPAIFSMSTRALALVYLTAHVWLFWIRPKRFLDIEVILQLLLLVAVFAGGKRQKDCGRRVTQIPRWVLVAGLAAFMTGGLTANRIFTAGRLIGGDESAYQFQSRIFASGHFKAPAPPADVFFEHHIIDSHGWFTKFSPGWPLVLAGSQEIGLDWAVNIVLGVVILGIVFSIGRRIYSEQEARLAMFLLLLSPVFFGNCLGQMSHPLCGGLLAGATLFYFRTIQSAVLWNAAAMLACIVAAISVRPLTGALFGVVLGGALIWEARHNRQRLRAILSLCVLFAAAAVCLCGAYNYEMTGAFTKFPYAEFSRSTIPVELMPEVSTASRNVRWSLVSTWAFAFPLLFPAASLALFCDRNKRREAVVLAALFLCLVTGYAPNRFSSGSFMGQRFYFEGIFAISLLAARGILLWEKSRRINWYLAPLAASALATLGLSLPAVFRAVQPYVEVRALAQNLPMRNGVVFLKTTDPEFIAKHYNLNQADWPRAPIFFTPDPGPEKRRSLAGALGRPTWAVIQYDAVERKAELETQGDPH